MLITLDDILDQPAALETLRRFLAADRLPHGMIFCGPVGVGKATTAAALAALFVCPQAKAQSPCGKCQSCRALAAGMHGDYHVITKELIRYHDKTGKSKGIDLSIEVIRAELLERASLKPTLGYGKVFVIEQAELMTTAGQNALLKTLEEPYGRTLIVLLTDQPDTLLSTIRSRCQTVRFTWLPLATVQAQLQKRGVDPSTAVRAAELSAGSLGLALRWVEDGVVQAAGELHTQLEELLAGRPAADLAGWFTSAAGAYAQKQLERDELASKDQATREGLSLYLRLAAEVFRRRLEETSDPASLERLCTAIDALRQSEVYLDANVNIPLVFQQFSLTLDHALLTPDS